MNSVISLTIPTSIATLVVPTSMVAEVVVGPVETFPLPGVNPWVKGYFYWRNYPVTLVSFDRLAANQDPEEYKRICVFYPLYSREQHDYFALTAVGEPRSTVIHQSVSKEKLPDELSHRFAASALRHNGATLVVPDIDSIKAAFYPDH